MTLINKAKIISNQNHSGQRYKGKSYYLYHILGVVDLLGKDATDHEIITALLHDTVEDTEYTLLDCQMDFGTSVARSVDAITKRSTETYKDYLLRVKSDDVAKKIKIHDAIFNLNECIKDGNFKRAEKYSDAINYLVGEDK